MLTHIAHNFGEPGEGPILEFEYQNHRDEVRTRRMEYRFSSFGSNEYYPEPAIFFTGVCLDKNQLRSFNTSRMQNVRIIQDPR